MSSDTLSTTGTLDASTLSASTAATASTATNESSPSSSSSSSSFDNDPELRLAEVDQYYRRPETPPRVVHVLPEPAPYAQLCFRRADSSTTTKTTKEKPNGGRLYILMVGSKQTPTKVCCSRKYKPLVEDDDHYFGETPVLGQASSSQSSSSSGADSSEADALVLDDLGWASNGWDDLRRTSLSSVSTTSPSSSSKSTSGNNDDDDDGRKSYRNSRTFWTTGKDSNPEEIVWQDPHWVEAMQDDDDSLSDAWRLLGESSVDYTVENTAYSLHLVDATVCGRFIRGFGLCRGSLSSKPYQKALTRPSSNPAASKQPEDHLSFDYAALP